MRGAVDIVRRVLTTGTRTVAPLRTRLPADLQRSLAQLGFFRRVARLSVSDWAAF
jgi:hypothetical protein